MDGHKAIIAAIERGSPPDEHVIVKICNESLESISNPIVNATEACDVNAGWTFLRGLIVEVVFDELTQWSHVYAICRAIKDVRPKDLWLRNIDNENLFAVYWDRKDIDPDNPRLPTEVIFEKVPSCI